jgi:hypothetical protein
VASNLTFQIDPHAVLGVVAGASLHDIREAYRRKAKQHHPDVGGEEWAFRIISQAYEVLSTARVAQATHAEFQSRSGPPPRAPSGAAEHTENQRGRYATHHHESTASTAKAPADDAVRPGVTDRTGDPTRVVEVEKLQVRYEVDHLWLLGSSRREDRYLSCCLTISWPASAVDQRGTAIPHAEETLQQLSEAFDEVHVHTPTVNSRCQVEDGRFQGWLSYPSAELASRAFDKLHDELNVRGLSVKQWSRDLIIPREWR